MTRTNDTSTAEIRYAVAKALTIGVFAWVFFPVVQLYFVGLADFSTGMLVTVPLVMLHYSSMAMGVGVTIAAFAVLASPWGRWWRRLRHGHVDTVPKEEIDDLEERLKDSNND